MDKERQETVNRGLLASINNEQISIAAGKCKTYMATVNRDRPEIKTKIDKLKVLVRQMIDVVKSM